MTIEYRQAGIADLDVLVPLAEAFAKEQEVQVPVNRLARGFEAYARSGLEQALGHTAACVMVAEKTDGETAQVLGYAVGLAQEPPPLFLQEPYTFVSDLYVLPRWRRRGIGTALVERVRGWGWVKGMQRVSLIVPAGSPLEVFGAKLGFQPLQTMLFYRDPSEKQ